MDKEKASKAIQDAISKADVALIDQDQKDIEAVVLATLATVINSDQDERKYVLLELSADDFYFQDNRTTFQAMKDLADAGDHVDQLTVQEKGATWPDLAKTDAPAALTYKKRIIARANKRQAFAIGADFQNKVDAANPDDLPGLVAGLQKAVFNLERTKRFAPPDKPEADLIDGFVANLEHPKPGYLLYQKDDRTRVEKGFRRLHELTKGLKAGLWVIAAPPSAGKTTFVVQLASHVAELNPLVPILFFSYEQSAEELRIKTLARLSGQDNEKIKEGKADKAKLEEARAKYKLFSKHLKIIDADVHDNVGMIRLKAQREKMKNRFAPVIFIDYLQAMPSADPTLQDRRQEIDMTISELRRLARDIGSPIVVVSSTSRGEYKNPTMKAFKESGGVEFGADVAAVLNVERDDKDNERSIELKVVKNRNGRRLKISFKYEMNVDRFTESSDSGLTYLDALGGDDQGSNMTGGGRGKRK
jgi:replicative DNA helicase